MEQNPCLRRYVVRDVDENKRLKRNDVCVDQAETPHFACSDDLKVGFLYEVDHKQLPPKYPIQLKVIRVVMLAEMNELNVSVRFPSTRAFRAYFSSMELEEVPGKKYPDIDIDEQFVMGLKIAKKVLLRQILPPEFQDQGRLRSFWLLPPEVTENSSSVLNSARELTQLKEEMTIIRREMQDYKRDMQELLLWKREHSNDKAIVPFVKSSTDQNSILECNNRVLVSTKEDCEDYMSLVNRKAEMDLVNIRKEAGVNDSYWTPPPGWKPGDSLSQDLNSARELTQLKEEMTIIRREMQELKDYKRDMLVKRKAEIEQQLLQISKSLQVMEEEMKGSREKAVEEEADPEVQILEATGESDETDEINEDENMGTSPAAPVLVQDGTALTVSEILIMVPVVNRHVLTILVPVLVQDGTALTVYFWLLVIQILNVA